MCDYSLHTNPNRLAVEGEELVAYRFPTGSMGLASPKDLQPVIQADESTPRRWWSWSAIKAWFEAQKAAREPVCAVCIPPGARLILKDIPQDLQRELEVGESEEVTFVQISANANSYRDAVRFSNSRQILLQALREQQRVEVVSLALAESMEPEHADQHETLVFP
ncbi:MAG: hypothetical protein ACK5AZ_06500 [Bryobacteraceae bacterium]